jgi:hypothetical protein
MDMDASVSDAKRMLLLVLLLQSTTQAAWAYRGIIAQQCFCYQQKHCAHSKQRGKD